MTAISAIGPKELTLLPLKAYIYAFGQIQVLAEFESSIFDEDKFLRNYLIGKCFFMILQTRST